MKYFVSEHNHEKYRPQATFKQRVFDKIKKQKQTNSQRRLESIRNQPAVLKNPYRQSNPGTLRRRIWWGIFALLMLTWIGLVCYLPYFRINKVTVTGLKIIKNEDVVNFITNNYLTKPGLIQKNNYFLVPADKIVEDLIKEYTLDKVNLVKVFPNEMRVEIVEKISTIIYDDGKNYYLLDQNGKIIRGLIPVAENEYAVVPSLAVTPSASSTLSLPASTTLLTDESSSTTPIALNSRVHTPNYTKIKNDFGQLPLLYDLRVDLNHSENQIVLPATLVKSVIDVVKEVEKQGMGGIKYCTVDNPLGGVRVLTENGLDFYYDPNADIVAQINNLKNIIKTNHPKEYIDLRYGNRVYWR